MKTLKELYEDKKKAKAKLKQINEWIDERKKETIVQCTYSYPYGEGCGMGFQIGGLEYIQTHWYESPYGCTGGDNWFESEGQFDCPACGHRNRLYDKPDIEALKYLFKSIKDEYKD